MSSLREENESLRQQQRQIPDLEALPQRIVGGVICWNVYESVESYDQEQKKNAWGEWRIVASYKTEFEADKNIADWEEHNHRMNSVGDYGIVRLRFEKRCEVIAPATGVESVTPPVSELLATVEQLRSELTSALSLNEALEAEVKKWVQSSAQAQYQLDDVIAERDNARYQLLEIAANVRDDKAKESQPLINLEAVRDRVLKSLNAGEQSKLYKRVKAELDQLLPPN